MSMHKRKLQVVNNQIQLNMNFKLTMNKDILLNGHDNIFNSYDKQAMHMNAIWSI